MAFHELSMKTEKHDYVEIPGFSSVMSLSYLSKFCFPNSKLKNMSSRRYLSGNHNFAHNIDIMNFVPSFRADYSRQSYDVSKALNSANNIKKIESCTQFSTMNILSYLVGGFVGSKSQIGFTSTQGDRFQIWDLVWQKLLEIMDNDGCDMKNSEFDNNSITDSNFKYSECEINRKPLKQSYADVAKKMPTSVSNKNKQVVRCVKENMTKLNKHKRKQHMLLDYNFRGKLDFGKCEKKHEINSFSSSRWSNSRKKHFRKGVEKLNRRDEREAARDGLEFVNQELCENNKSILTINNSINCIRIAERGKEITGSTSRGKASKKGGHNQEIMDDDRGRRLGNFNKKSTDDCDKVEFSAIISPNCDDSFRCRLGSACSVDSDDSFIIFDKTGDEDLITPFCYNDIDLQTIDDDSSDCSSSLSDIDSDSYVMLQTSYNEKHADEMCINKNKQKNICNKNIELNKDNKPSDVINEVQWKNMHSHLRYEKDVPYTCVSGFRSEGNSKFCVETSDCRMNFRSVSECSVGSEDSSVTFGSIDEESSDNGSSEFEDCDSDEDFEKIYCAVLSPYPNEHNYNNRSWLDQINSEWESKLNENAKTSCKNSPKKRVQFAPDDKLVSVRMMLTWDYALRAARVGLWEQLARDTMRFQNRIQCVGEVLKNVLDSKHREKVWKERFSGI